MSFQEVLNLAQQKGFFFRSAESYPNIPAGFWDYGPLGVSMKRNFQELWRRMLVKRNQMVELDGAQIMPKGVFQASGHLTNFTDPIVRCAKCGAFNRPDKLIEDKTGKLTPEKLSDPDYDRIMLENHVICPKCGFNLSGTKRFNMMFGVAVGAMQEEAFLRPETCQSIFVDFPLLFKTQRLSLPVGFAQVGKSFRNEIAPRQALIRLRELNQAEIEIFFNPKWTNSPMLLSNESIRLRLATPEGEITELTVGDAVHKGLVPNNLIGYYIGTIQELFSESGIASEKTRFRSLSDEEKAFYSAVAYDFEVQTSVGWVEMVACNYRTDYDLSRHSSVSGSDFSVYDHGEKVIPHVFELSLGIDRSIYAILESALKINGDRRLLELKNYLAPVAVCVFPLVNKDGLPELASGIYDTLLDTFEAFYDDSGSIGRRYARADEMGVPFCVTVDHDSTRDKTVTLRDRDTKKQERIKMDELPERLGQLTAFPPISG